MHQDQRPGQAGDGGGHNSDARNPLNTAIQSAAERAALLPREPGLGGLPQIDNGHSRDPQEATGGTQFDANLTPFQNFLFAHGGVATGHQNVVRRRQHVRANYDHQRRPGSAESARSAHRSSRVRSQNAG